MVEPRSRADDDAPTSQAAVVSLPQIFGPCRLIRRLGAGGMATVYLAEMVEERPYAPRGAEVAVKVLDREQFGGADAIQRFLREAQLGGSVAHPGLVRTYDHQCIEVGPAVFHYLILEYVAGRSLGQLMKELRVIPEGLLRDLGVQVAAALQALHLAGIVHRDVKPSNILITPDHQVKLTDLGIARAVDDTAHLTQTGLFVGTPLYASPEHLLGQAIGPGSDLYSLGVVLYQASTGRHPFAGGGVQAVMLKHLDHVPPKAGQLNSQVSPFLEEVIACLLEKESGRRFASATELGRTLEQGEASAWWREREALLRAAHPRRELRRIRVPRETAHVGREQELQVLRAAYDEARAGRGHVVLIEGEAGVGKSRLVDELLRRLGDDREEPHVLYGSYSPGASARTPGALAEAIVTHFGEASLETDLARPLAGTPRLVRSFAAFLIGAPPPEGADPLTAEALHTLFCNVARALAAERPLVWIIEDLHFGTAEARALLVSLARIAPELPLLLVATARPGLPAEEVAYLERLPATRRLVLARLSPREVIHLLCDALRSEPLAEQLGGRLALKTDGNPFFILEVLRDLKERQCLAPQADGSYAAAQTIERITVPTSVRDLLLAHLRDMPREDRALLDLGAVQGFSFDPDLLARVRETKRLQVLESLAAIERRYGVVRSTGAGFQFDHHQLQEVLYGALPPMLRAEYHALLAEAFAARARVSEGPATEVPGDVAVFLAEHYFKGGQQPEGARFVLRAMDHLAALYQNERLVELAASALARIGDTDSELRCNIRLRQAECLDLLSRRDLQQAAADDALAAAQLVGDLKWVARARVAQGWALYTVANFRAALEVLTDAAEQARRAGDHESEARAIGVSGGALRFLGHRDEARRLHGHQLELLRRFGLRHREAYALMDLAGDLMELGDYKGVHACAEQCIAVARQVGARRAEASALMMLSNLANIAGCYDQAMSFTQQLLQLAREIGFRIHEGTALAQLGLIRLKEGRLHEADAGLRQSLDLYRLFQYKAGEASLIVCLGDLALAKGEREKAHTCYREALMQTRALGFPILIAEAACAAGRAFTDSDPDAAICLLREADELSNGNSLAFTGTLPAAYLALLGQKDPRSIEVPEAMYADARAEAHLVLFLAGGGEEHLPQARTLLERMSAHLRGADADAFWRNNPTARRANAI